MNKKLARVGIFIALCSFTFCGRIFAADIVSGQDPGAQAKRYKYDVDKQRQELEQKTTRPEGININEEKAAPQAAGVAFELKEVKITGSTIFSPQDLRPIYAPYLNHKVTFTDLDAIARKIEARYRQKGYFTTSVYIPEQDIKDGIVQIRIAEGKMGKLNIEGNKWFSRSLIESYVHIKENEILNVKTLSRDILRLNKNPDLEVKAVLAQGKEAQTSDVTLKVVDKFPWYLGFLEDNRGSRLTGKYRSMVSERGSNVSGIADTLFLNTLYTGNSSAESVSYTIPIGTYGTKFGLDVTYFRMKLGKEFKPFDITGTTQIYTPHFSWELVLAEDFEAYADLGLNIKSIKKEQDSDPVAKDQLSIPYFGFNFTKTDSQGQSTFSPRFNFGTSGFLGSFSNHHSLLSRAETGGSFFKYEQSLNRIQRMFLGSYMSIRTQLQVASRTLDTSEQFQLGGADSVRGYPEGDYLADTAGCINFDWFFPSYFIPAGWKLAGQDLPLRRQIEPVIFADVGAGRLKRVLPGEVDGKFLSGVGAGLRFNFKYFSLRLDWAKAIGAKQTSGSGPSTFYFTFQSEV
jgi:hemolysin activation/secretion protein